MATLIMESLIVIGVKEKNKPIGVYCCQAISKSIIWLYIFTLEHYLDVYSYIRLLEHLTGEPKSSLRFDLIFWWQKVGEMVKTCPI